MEHDTTNKEVEKPAEVYSKLQPSKKKSKKAKNPTKVSYKSQIFDKNNKEAENLSAASTKAQSSKKIGPKSLRARSKVVKKSSASNSLKPRRPRRNRKKNKIALEGIKESGKNEDDDGITGNPDTREENMQTNLANKKHIEKGSGGSDGSNQPNNIELDGRKRNERDKKKKEKLGGLNFMCSAKTKPDCLHYRVMGVTMRKKDLVLSVKPGLKLFLYDFDLKLMYGIYEASSSGGMRLEPKAFGGSFPVQVRFCVHKNCFPLPESVFKRAIKENYDEHNKFNIELTVQQFSKLSKLFQPALQPSAASVCSPAMASIGGLRELQPPSSKEEFLGAIGDAMSYLPSFERNQHMEYGAGVSRQREEISHSLFMSEKEYRTFGLQGERINLASPHHIPSAEPYQRDLVRGNLLGQPAPVYRDAGPVQREPGIADPLYLTQRDFQTCNISVSHELPTVAPSVTATASGSTVTALGSYQRDPYYSYRYGVSSVDAYLPPPRREEVSLDSHYANGRKVSYLAEASLLGWRETDQVNKLYSTYSVDPLSNYSQVYSHHGFRPETVATPVSSRYCFSGPSVSYR